MNSDSGDHADRLYPVLLLIFVGSGCSALIYEVVWFELLRQVIGASSLSLAIVLTSFMAGLFVGSAGFSRWVSTSRHPLKVYAALELGIGVIAIGLLYLLPLVGLFYLSVVGYGPGAILLRALICLVCLLPPTIMMGATLPALARWMKASRIGISRLGFLYSANIAGAVLGCMLAGFYLLRVHDLVVATWFAAWLNGLVALTALLSAWRVRYGPEHQDAASAPRLPVAGVASVRAVHVVIGLSGLTALGAQVVWTRLLSLLFGATVYSFTIILAVFLTGLGLGSSLGASLGRRITRPGVALAWSQLLLVAAIPFSAYMINQVLPFWTLASESYANYALRFSHDLLRGAAAMLPSAFLWGVSFPLALAAARRKEDEPGRLVGRIYAWNTLGAIVGAMAIGMMAIPWLGTQHAQQSLTALAGISALLMFGASSWLPRWPDGRWSPSVFRRSAMGSLGIVVAFSAVMIWIVAPTEPLLIAYGRTIDTSPPEVTYEYLGEGRSSSVAVTTNQENGMRSMHVGGKVVSSTTLADARLNRMLGHLPALFHRAPKSVLIVGFGAGMTAGSFVAYPEIERIVICEIEPRVTEAAGRYFSTENYGVLDDPRTEVIYDDARHFIATTDETFDIITSDPIHPWVRGAAALYSTEYYELAKRRLNPGGIVVQWVPLYDTDLQAVKSQIGTFMLSFPEGTIWSSATMRMSTVGYDLVLLGQEGPLAIDVVELTYRLGENPRVRRSLAAVQFPTLPSLLSAYAGQGPELAGWLRGAQINRDRSLRLQYLAGLALAVGWEESSVVYSQILARRTYPYRLFVAPAELEDVLRSEF